MRQFYYKMRHLLQNTTILLQNVTVTTKCDVYYKLRQYNIVWCITYEFWSHICLLIYFMLLVSFYTPWKQKTRDFLILSVGIEGNQWREMG